MGLELVTYRFAVIALTNRATVLGNNFEKEKKYKSMLLLFHCLFRLDLHVRHNMEMSQTNLNDSISLIIHKPFCKFFFSDSTTNIKSWALDARKWC